MLSFDATFTIRRLRYLVLGLAVISFANIAWESHEALMDHELSGHLGPLLMDTLGLILLATGYYSLTVWQRERERLTAMAQALPEGFALFDRDSRLLVCNQPWAALYHCPPAALRGRTVADLLTQVYPSFKSVTLDGTRPIHSLDELLAAWRVHFSSKDSLIMDLLTHDQRSFRARSHTAPGGERLVLRTEITDLKNREAALQQLEQDTRRREERLEAAIDVAADGFALFDAEDHLIRCNQAFAALYGRDANALTGIHHDELLRDGHRRGVGLDIGDLPFEQWLARLYRNRRRQHHRQVELRSYDGRWFLVTERLTASNELVLVRTDITRQKRQEQELRRLASTDSLTGALNHGHFMQKAAAEMRRAQRYRHPLALLMLDADHFKQINDTQGHAAGDQVLRELVATLGQELRENDLLGRLGGEEFAAMLPETDHQAANLVADRLRQRLAALVFPGRAGEFGITVSIGVAILGTVDKNLEDLLKRADQALYQAKEMGRDRVCSG